jgi:hypothetical protein
LSHPEKCQSDHQLLADLNLIIIIMRLGEFNSRLPSQLVSKLSYPLFREA